MAFLKLGGKKKGKQDETEEKSKKTKKIKPPKGEKKKFFGFGKKKKADNIEDTDASGERPAGGKKKFRIRGLGFILAVLIISTVGIGGVAYGYLYFTGGLEEFMAMEIKPIEFKPIDIKAMLPKKKPKPIVIDTDLQKLLDMYNLQNTQAGKIETLEEENTVLTEKTSKLEYTVKVYKDEVTRIDPEKVAVLDEIAEKGPPPPPPENTNNGTTEDGKPKPPPTFDEPEGGWETNEKLAEKLSDGTIKSVEGWNNKYGGWVCIGVDEKRYIVIPSGTSIEADKLGI